MNRLILHHYPTSPFAEKIRLIFGFKSLHWTSVHIPMVMPKPDVVALTGGYRKTPILQIGADVYCDTALIADVIDGIAPSPALYPQGVAAAARTLAQWADSTLFWTAIPYALQPAGLQHMFKGSPPEAIKAFGEDRTAFRANLPRMRAPESQAALGIYLKRLEEMIGERSFVLGAKPSIADFSLYHCLWFVVRGGPPASILEAFPRVEAWRERLRAFGHGTNDELDSGAAIDIARQSARPCPPRGLASTRTASRPATRWWWRRPTRARSPSTAISMQRRRIAFPSRARIRAPDEWPCISRGLDSSCAAEPERPLKDFF